MTRLQQYRIRRAKLRTSQERLEAALDAVIPSLELPPSEAFQAVLAYAIDGLVAQGTVYVQPDTRGRCARPLSVQSQSHGRTSSVSAHIEQSMNMLLERLRSTLGMEAVETVDNKRRALGGAHPMAGLVQVADERLGPAKAPAQLFAEKVTSP